METTVLQELGTFEQTTLKPARSNVRKSPLHILILAALVILGASLRLMWLPLVEFRHDSAYWALDGLRLLRNGEIPLIGQQVGSVHIPFYNGPFLTYVTTLVFGVFGPHPTVMSGFIALANTLAIVITYLLGYRLYSSSVGIIAATLLAIAPWMVLYGRMYWPQALFPLLMATAFYILLHAIENKRAIWYISFGVLMGIGVQLHLSVLAIVGTSVIYILIYGRPRWALVPYGLGLSLGYAPIILYDLWNGFSNIQAILFLPNLHATEEPRLIHMAKTIWNFSNVLSGQGMWVSKLSKTAFIPAWVDWTQGLLMTGLFGFAVSIILYNAWASTRSLRHLRLSHQDGLVLLFVGLPLLYLFFSRSLIQRHYFIFLTPITMIVIARGLTLWIYRTRLLPRLVTLTPIALLCIGLTFNLYTATSIFASLQQSGGEGEYGTVFSDKEAAVATIIAMSSEGFVVDLTETLEPLPFVFLFERHTSIVTVGDEATATRILGGNMTASSRHYRIVELRYVPLTLKPHESVIYQHRGIAVVEQQP